MGRRAATVLVWCVVGLLCARAQAQTGRGQISGRVLNARDGEPLGHVRVEVLDAQRESDTDDDDGRFTFADLPPGPHELRVSSVDFHVEQQAFDLAAGEAKSFDVRLTPSTITLSDTAVVTADPFVTESGGDAGFTLQGEERKNLAGVLTDDPVRAVQSAPGVTANDDFSAGFAVRGAPFGRVGLYLDGVLMHAPFHTIDGQPDNGSLATFSSALIDRMTLYEGAWPVQYGNRTAGVLAIETRQGTRDRLRADVDVGVSDATVTMEGPVGRARRAAFLVSARKSFLQYILNHIDFGDEPPFVFGFADVDARVDVDVNAANAVSLTVLHGVSAVDRTRYADRVAPTATMTSGFSLTQLNATWRHTSATTIVTTRAAYATDAGHVESPRRLPLSTQTYREGTARTDATRMFGTHRALDVGGEVHEVRQSGTATTLVYTPALLAALDVFGGTTRRAGGYLGGRTAFGSVDLAAGGRVDADRVTGRALGSGYGSLVMPVGPRTRIEAHWGRAGQFPELAQLLSRYAGPGRLRPERSSQLEAILDRRIDDRTRVQVELYERRDLDLLARPAVDPRLGADGVVVAAVPTAPWRNSQHGTARGVQVLLQRRSANGFTGWVSYAYGRTRLRDDALGVWFPSDNDQRHTLNAYVSRRLRASVNISGRLTFGSGMPLPGFYALDGGDYRLSTARNALRAPTYQRADVRVNKALVHPTFSATLFAEVVNVTNRTNRDFDSAGPYDLATGRTTPSFFTMLPVLPSVGLTLSFDAWPVHRHHPG